MGRMCAHRAARRAFMGRLPLHVETDAIGGFRLNLKIGYMVSI